MRVKIRIRQRPRFRHIGFNPIAWMWYIMHFVLWLLVGAAMLVAVSAVWGYHLVARAMNSLTA